MMKELIALVERDPKAAAHLIAALVSVCHGDGFDDAADSLKRKNKKYAWEAFSIINNNSLWVY